VVLRLWNLSYLSPFFPLAIQNIDMLPTRCKYRRRIDKLPWAGFGNHIAVKAFAVFK
jgi:hypothetical protein